MAKRDLVARIDAADIEARLVQAKALAEAAEAQLARIDAAIEQARLGTEVTRGTLAQSMHQAEEALEQDGAAKASSVAALYLPDLRRAVGLRRLS